ncbi:YopX family protein [Acetobacterium wieringae]|uniref:YopX family protein n=1 Tax=Acetobacterium wieringae TaxID=52694 RepID=A0ABY6HBF1_9FIRM|nr:YopX family protein [Acetobacterium wieringae]UYO61838.1 YopX family protein [Acetobacterium wieringae]
MREILFRGKRTDNDEWVEGSFVPDLLEVKGGSDMVSWGFIKSPDLERIKSPMYEVERETVGQYTGLKDCNGLRIFEGDILKFKVEDAAQEMLVKVCYGEFVDENDSQFYLGWHVVGNGMTVSIFNGKDDGYDLLGMCKVAGSIHDNPELLEVQE